MSFLLDLWLPVLLSAVTVFVVSSVLHMVTKLHKNDYQKMKNEAQVLEALRAQGVGPGMYMFPCADSMKDMANPEYQAKCDLGPVGHMILRPNGMWNMNKSLLQWFAYSVLVALLTAYVARIVLANGTDPGLVLRVTSTVATMGFALGSIQDSIWKGVRWSVTAKFLLDGLIYGLTTGAVFAWRWPGV